MTRKEKIIGFMSEKTYIPLMAEELEMVLDVKSADRDEFYRLLAELEEEGAILRSRKGRLECAEKLGLLNGTYLATRHSFGFVRVEGVEEDFKIDGDKSRGAFPGDLVQIRVTGQKRNPRAEIVRILKHATTRIVGTFEAGDAVDFVVPDNEKIDEDILISKKENHGALTGHKVVCEITRFGDGRRQSEGKVIEILGFSGDFGVDMLSILRGYGFETEFSEEVKKEAEAVPSEVPAQDMEGRLDLRDMRIFTIDGADAKDLDDAISVEKLQNGNYRLGVHIADVSHYVKEKSPIDKEAYQRGTSVYLADRVVPMLPVQLSNGLCSLHGGVDRLTLSCLMEIDGAGKVVDYEIKESVICSCARMTYDDVTAILEEEPPELMERYRDLIPDFRLAKELAELLKKARVRRGSVDFTIPEAKVILNEENRCVDIRVRKETVSNRMIEQFMLLANETVAEHLFWNQKPAVYRVHENPSRAKMVDLSKFLYGFGINFKVGENVHPKQLQQVMEVVKETPAEQVISTVMVRSMMKAEYSHENKGHFALASKYYCHFTSPIRRYPDLVVHRVLKMMLHGTLTEKKEQSLATFVASAAKQSSDREVAAAMAERDTTDIKKAEYMEEHIGEEFLGIVSSVTGFGFFVQLENTVEGLVRLADLRDDYYRYDEKNYCLIGERTRHKIMLGDQVKIKVVAASGTSGQIDFILLGGNQHGRRKKNRRTKQKGKA